MNDQPFEEIIELDDQPGEMPKEDLSEPLDRTLLEVWTILLQDGLGTREAPIQMQDALAIISRHPFVPMSDLQVYNDTLYDLVQKALDSVVAIVQDNPECLDNTGEGEDSDAIKNHGLYLMVIVDWNTVLLEHVKTWTHTMENAEARLAGHIDASNMLIGSQGLLNHLDQINFKYGEEDRDRVNSLIAAVQED